MQFLFLATPLLTLALQAQQGVVGPTYRFADFDRDGLADVYVVRPSARDRLFRNLGDGTFVDVSDALGLADISGSRLALWQDYDGDGWIDLYVGAQTGRSRLLRNDEGRAFVDTTLASGLEHEGRELFAEWLDFDLDGWADLHVVTERGDQLWRNVGGRFEVAQLPDVGESNDAVIALQLPNLASVAPTGSAASTPDETPDSSMGGQLAITGHRCQLQLKDIATNNCLSASTTPTLGALYPLSSNFNVSATGNVGIGTTSPGAKLDIVGDVRASGQLVSSAIGAAPLIVSSTGKVTNLNVDLLDGLDSSAFSQLGATIEGSEISASTITATNLASGSVTSAKIAASAVTSSLIADATITGADVATGTLTSADIALDTLTGANIAVGAVASSEILDGAVSAVDLAADSVTSGAIADGTIAANDLAAGAVTTTTILNGTIAAADIATGTITSAQIANGAIDYDKLANPLSGQVSVSQGSAAYTAKVSNTGTAGIRDGLRIDIDSSSGYGAWVVNNGTTALAYAVRGQSDSVVCRAVYGEATTTAATVAYGIYGLCHNTAAFGVYSDGDFGGTGAKYFIQPHPNDPSKQVNFACLEGNESGTYFRGSIQIVGGVGNIEVPESFRLVTEPDSLTATATAVGAPALVWIESQSLDRVIVRANLDVTVNYVVNGTRRGFRGLETIRENTSFVPEYRGLPFGLQYRPEQRQLLVQSGVLNADFTPNEATAKQLGWELKDPWNDEHAEPLVRSLIRAGLVVAPAGWIAPSERAAVDDGR